ncbi:MAG TPA: ParB/RepB/Spo0J family partition protein [Candidatus Limnocylindrales bacterium]|nr:ParB/RepB/Spo0J family partition protein [Candidatus Limnocylindrales bacterium]
MNKRRGLGRGLEALIPSGDSVAVEGGDRHPAAGSPLRLRIAGIALNPDQPRRTFDPTALRELADSIREHGILQPLLVRERPDGYELIAGERRLRAAEMAGLTEVPVVVHERLLAGGDERLELALVENLQREDLNPVEQAQALDRLCHEFGMTQEAVGERIGKSRFAVANAIRLLRLPPPVLRAMEAGEITAAHGQALLGLSGDAERLSGLERITREGWSVRQTEAWVAARRERPTTAHPRKTRRAVDPDTLALEEEFRRALGTKVVLTRLKQGGRLTIEYYSDDELEGLRRRLVTD